MVRRADGWSATMITGNQLNDQLSIGTQLIICVIREHGRSTHTCVSCSAFQNSTKQTAVPFNAQRNKPWLDLICKHIEHTLKVASVAHQQDSGGSGVHHGGINGPRLKRSPSRSGWPEHWGRTAEKNSRFDCEQYTMSITLEARAELVTCKNMGLAARVVCSAVKGSTARVDA